MHSTQKGFTFIEIVISIAIIGLLAAVVGPAYLRWLERGRITATKASIKGVKLEIDTYYSDIGDYPQSLKVLVKRPFDEEAARDWRGPYLKEIPRDGWKRKFIYRLNPEGTEPPYELYSYGAKGKGASSSEWIRA